MIENSKIRKHSIFLYFLLFLSLGCVGPNPNTGERTADLYLNSSNWTDFHEHVSRHAQEGDPWAMLRLGYAYEKGYGVNQNYEEAFKWYSKTAIHEGTTLWEKGNVFAPIGKSGFFGSAYDAAHAQFRIGLMYLDGKGVKKDIEIAYMCFMHLSKSGFITSVEGRKLADIIAMIEGELSSSKLSELKGISNTWQVPHVPHKGELSELSAVVINMNGSNLISVEFQFPLHNERWGHSHQQLKLFENNISEHITSLINELKGKSPISKSYRLVINPSSNINDHVSNIISIISICFIPCEIYHEIGLQANLFSGTEVIKKFEYKESHDVKYGPMIGTKDLPYNALRDTRVTIAKSFVSDLMEYLKEKEKDK